MKILFVDFLHADQTQANINCIDKLRKQMMALGTPSDVLTFRSSRAIPCELEDACGRVYSVDTWMRFSVVQNAKLTKLQLALKNLCILPIRVFHVLVGGRYVYEKRYAPLACRSLKKRLQTLCRTEAYDWVIATCYPFCILETVAAVDLGGAKLAFHYLDPYWDNQSHSKQNASVRLREEYDAVAKTDLIVAAPEHLKGWQTPPLSDYVGKVRVLPYPNLVPYEGNYEPSLVELEKDSVNLVYIGTLCDGIRSPEGMLRLFRRMLDQNPQLRLYVVGQAYGHGVNQQINKAQTTLGDRLVRHATIPFPQAMDLIRRSDIVINLGNRMQNQMPSKLLDYIAAGKPILNISPNKPCNTAPYISRYPWAMQCYEDELQSDSDVQHAAEKALSFIKEYRGKTLAWDQIKSAMAGYTAEDVAQQFLEALCDATNK